MLAAATLVDGAVYFFWQRSLGHPPSAPFVQTISYNLIGTTVIGTFVLYMRLGLQSDRHAKPAIRFSPAGRAPKRQFLEAQMKASRFTRL